MIYNASPETYEAIIDMQEARIEAMQKRIEALEAVSNPVLKAEFETQDFIFNKLFKWPTSSICLGWRSA